MVIKYKEDKTVDLEASIDSYYDGEKRKTKSRSYFYVSELGKDENTLCDNLKGIKREGFSPRVKRILSNGNSMHERYIKLFAEMGMLVAAEIYAVENELLHGRCDCILTDKYQNYVVDMKSTSIWVFNKLEESSLPHKLQLLAYMYYLNIPRGFMLYENKNDQAIKTFYLEMDDKNKQLIESEINKLQKLKDKIDLGFEPVLDKNDLEAI